MITVGGDFFYSLRIILSTKVLTQSLLCFVDKIQRIIFSRVSYYTVQFSCVFRQTSLKVTSFYLSKFVVLVISIISQYWENHFIFRHSGMSIIFIRTDTFIHLFFLFEKEYRLWLIGYVFLITYFNLSVVERW